MLATLWALRRGMLGRTAFKPGPIDVKEFETDIPTGDPVPAAKDLTARFQRQLSETDLYAPINLPAEAPAENFLDLLGDVNLQPKNLASSLLHLVSRLRPRIAYRVNGVLTVRDADPCFGLTVTLTSYAIRGSRMQTFWEQSWEQAVRSAGFWVMASLIPVTRFGRNQPWRPWRDRNLPPELFAAYQQGREFARNRRFDEALDKFYRALHMDPQNAYLRNQIGTVQEQLGLYLDAMETYYDVISAAGLGKQKEHDRLWGGWWQRATARLHGCKPALLQARYRFAVILGTSELTAEQWCKPEGTPARDTAREHIRQALAPALTERYSAGGGLGENNTDDKSHEQALPQKFLGIDSDEGEGRANQEEIELIFQLISAFELRRLFKDFNTARFFLKALGRSRELALTKPALKVGKDAWAPLRLSQKWREVNQLLMKQDRSVLSTTHVPIADKMNLDEISLTYPSPKEPSLPLPHWRRDWQAHYNAGCVLSVAMRTTRNRGKLAERACQELKMAVQYSTSGYVPLARSWLLYEDPDLAELRKEQAFKRFVREFFPHATPNLLPIAQEGDEKRVRPTDIEVTAYDREFLGQIGKAMERVWHERAAHLPANLAAVGDWFAREKLIWKLMDTICASQARNWPNREQLLGQVNEVTDPSLRARLELPPAVPELEQILELDNTILDQAWTQVDDAAKRMKDLPRVLDEQLLALHRTLRSRSRCSPIEYSQAWLEEVRRRSIWGWDPLRKEILRDACDRYAKIWHVFATQFSALVDPGMVTRDFAVAAEELCALEPLLLVDR
ncbi:hypothetical protein AB0C21_12620 [Spirillospora sp. NPDC049024]